MILARAQNRARVFELNKKTCDTLLGWYECMGLKIVTLTVLHTNHPTKPFSPAHHLYPVEVPLHSSKGGGGVLCTVLTHTRTFCVADEDSECFTYGFNLGERVCVYFVPYSRNKQPSTSSSRTHMYTTTHSLSHLISLKTQTH